MEDWKTIVRLSTKPEGAVKIGIIGKYTGLKDAYKSLSEALAHGGIANNVLVELKWIDAESFDDVEFSGELDDINGILVPGGFGERGSNGKIRAASFARGGIYHFLESVWVCKWL